MIIKLEGTAFEEQLHKLEQKLESIGPKARVFHGKVSPSHLRPTFKVGLRRVVPITESTGGTSWPLSIPTVGRSSFLPYRVFSPPPPSSGPSPSTSDMPITEPTGSKTSISLWPSPIPPVGQSSLLPYTVFSPSPSSSVPSPSTSDMPSDMPSIEHVSDVLTFTPSISPDEYAIFSERTIQSSESGESVQEEKTSEVQENEEQTEEAKKGTSGKLLLVLGLAALYFMIGE